MAYLNSITDLSNYILDCLKENCTDVDFVPSYPNTLTEFPVKRPTVSVGIIRANLPFNECTFKGLDMSGYAYYGTSARCTYSFKICIPKTMPGEKCYETFDKVADVCLGMGELYIQNIYCEGITYDRVMGALVLSAGVEMNVDLLSVIQSGEVFIPEDSNTESEE